MLIKIAFWYFQVLAFSISLLVFFCQNLTFGILRFWHFKDQPYLLMLAVLWRASFWHYLWSIFQSSLLFWVVHKFVILWTKKCSFGNLVPKTAASNGKSMGYQIQLHTLQIKLFFGLSGCPLKQSKISKLKWLET